MEFGSAHCQTLNFRFRFADFNLVVGPELPFPDPRIYRAASIAGEQSPGRKRQRRDENRLGDV
jgi:hypothetical protein